VVIHSNTGDEASSPMLLLYACTPTQWTSEDLPCPSCVSGAALRQPKPGYPKTDNIVDHSVVVGISVGPLTKNRATAVVVMTDPQFKPKKPLELHAYRVEDLSPEANVGTMRDMDAFLEVANATPNATGHFIEITDQLIVNVCITCASSLLEPH
jgi:hypothetical protein